MLVYSYPKLLSIKLPLKKKQQKKEESEEDKTNSRERCFAKRVNRAFPSISFEITDEKYC